MKSKLEEALERIEDVQTAMEGHPDVVVLVFRDLDKKELEQFAKQENIYFIEPNKYIHYCFSIFNTKNVKAHLRTTELNIKFE